jgi:hypothetical protein
MRRQFALFTLRLAVRWQRGLLGRIRRKRMRLQGENSFTIFYLCRNFTKNFFTFLFLVDSNVFASVAVVRQSNSMHRRQFALQWQSGLHGRIGRIGPVQRETLLTRSRLQPRVPQRSRRRGLLLPIGFRIDAWQ